MRLCLSLLDISGTVQRDEETVISLYHKASVFNTIAVFDIAFIAVDRFYANNRSSSAADDVLRTKSLPAYHIAPDALVGRIAVYADAIAS